MESGSHKKPVLESSSRSLTVMRKRVSSSFAAYLVVRQLMDKKILELAEEKMGSVGMARFRFLYLGQWSMQDMIDDTASQIFDRYFPVLRRMLEKEGDEETEEEEDFDWYGTVLCDELSRLIVQFLRVRPGEDSLLFRMRWKSISDSISSYIDKEIQGEAVVSDPLVTVTNERSLEKKHEESEEKQEKERSLEKEIEGQAVVSDPLVTVTKERSSEKKHENTKEKQEKERSFEEKEIEGEAVLAEGRLATVTTGRALEAKEIEGEAVLAEGRLATVTTGRALEGKEIEGDAVISKDKAAEMEETFARARDIMSEPWRKEFEGEPWRKAFEGEAAVVGGSLGTVTTDRGLEGKEIEGEAAVVGGSLGTVTMDRGLEGKEIEGEAVISKDKAAEIEEEAFALFRRGWEHVNGGSNFEDLTLFSPMIFTHCTPGFKPIDAVLAKTVQICSIKIADVNHFKWPLQVYGVVAARDCVDTHRNPIFLRPRDDCQIISDVDPFLHLTGPVRAIVSEEPVDIEIQLIVKGSTASEDRALISYPVLYDGDHADTSGMLIVEKNFCTLELSFQQLNRSVQATVFGVNIIGEKSASFGYGVRIVCSSLSQHGIEDTNESTSKEVLLLDSRVGRPAIKRGYINLSRQVISVELSGRLKLQIQAYTPSGDMVAQGHVVVVPKQCNTSDHECNLGSFKIGFTIAWSLLIEDEEHILMNGRVNPFASCPLDPEFFRTGLISYLM